MTSYPDGKNSSVGSQMGETPLRCFALHKWIAFFHNHIPLLAAVTGQRSTYAIMAAIKRLSRKQKNDGGNETEHVPYGGPGSTL